MNDEQEGLGDPVRLALLGAGIFADQAHVPALLALPERFRVVAVYSRTRAKAEAVAARFPGDVAVATDPADVLARDDVEAVDVVLPIPLLVDTVERALRAGKHVVSEKPVAPTSAAGEQLAEVHRRDHAERVWMVAENWRYEAGFVAAAEAVRAGRISRPVLFDWALRVPIRPGHRYHATTWRRTGEVPGGFLLDAGVHFAAVLRMVLGEPVEARALTSSVHADLPPADTLAAALRFDSGAVGSLAVTYAVGAPWQPALRVTGTEGALTIDRDRLEITCDGASDVRHFDGPTGVRDELAAFAASVRHGVAHRNTADEALRDVRLVESWFE